MVSKNFRRPLSEKTRWWRLLMVITLVGVLAPTLSPAKGALATTVVTPTFVGNPFKATAPDGGMEYGRNIWDMENFNGRIYFGYGNSANAGPALGLYFIPVR